MKNVPEFTFKCAVCGKSYDTIDERSTCETKCLRARKEAEALKKMHEEKEERLNSEKEINEVLDKADKMVREYLNKYENFTMSRSYYYLSYLFRKVHWWF